ncbi:hypothetical protein [Thermaurantimonas aggregans]|uniref:hypothetical protein n=1 Tax=Thermaurantimonas aggregans TaxID=2173829 RepID=UPI0023F45EC2|nr:hypothetical protein [Thermaurantimonas aggregans]MCX8148143.1 hypothetical protein [Thermaurantimonas aggregans]
MSRSGWAYGTLGAAGWSVKTDNATQMCRAHVQGEYERIARPRRRCRRHCRLGHAQISKENKKAALDRGERLMV